jgi:hypothetical protein
LPGLAIQISGHSLRKGPSGVWNETEYMYSRHLKAAIPEWIGFIESEQGAYESSIRERLLSTSPPTIDRVLKSWKAQKGISLSRAGSFRDQIPIQENLWDIELPGYMEIDKVAHCGGSILGEYVHTITMVDISSTWTEVRAVFGKGSTGVAKSIEVIENSAPFELLGYDSDNGTEVLNQHILRYFRTEREERNRKPVLMTRSRAYRKNDNAHVEQRKNSINRRWLGYERLDFSEITPLVDFYFRSIICPLMTHFLSGFKLLDKRRCQSRTQRI